MKKTRLENNFLIIGTKITEVIVNSEYVSIVQITDNDIQGRDSANTISMKPNIAKQLANVMLNPQTSTASFSNPGFVTVNYYRHHNIIVIEQIVYHHAKYSSAFSIVFTDNEAQEIALFIKGKL